MLRDRFCCRAHRKDLVRTPFKASNSAVNTTRAGAEEMQSTTRAGERRSPHVLLNEQEDVNDLGMLQNFQDAFHVHVILQSRSSCCGRTSRMPSLVKSTLVTIILGYEWVNVGRQSCPVNHPNKSSNKKERKMFNSDKTLFDGSLMLKYCPMLQHSGLLENIWNVVRLQLSSCLRHHRRCVRHRNPGALHHCSSCPPGRELVKDCGLLRELHKLTCCSPPHKRRASQRKLESADERKRWRHAPHCGRCAPRKSGEIHPRLERHIWKGPRRSPRPHILHSMLLALVLCASGTGGMLRARQELVRCSAGTSSTTGGSGAT